MNQNAKTKINVKVKILTQVLDRTGSKTASGQVIDSISSNIKTIFLTNASKKDLFKVVTFYLLRNVGMSEFIRFSENSMAMECSTFAFPPAIEHEFYHPTLVSVQEALVSPHKRRINLQGTISEVSDVLQTENSKRKIIKLTTNGDSFAVKLWEKQTDTLIPDLGADVEITCIQVTEFKGAKEANSTEITTINEITTDTEFNGEIETATFNDMEKSWILLQNETDVWKIDNGQLNTIFPNKTFEPNTNVMGTRKGTISINLV